ncbi:MAG TPA: branched-chain amino acid transaminase [Deltaproteobacteria bacterium]|nr:branched-chain amino acid transaminase [Deltaproteobacteria bacterium]
MEKTEKIWFNGKLVGWDEAKVHVLTHTLHYGLGVFEGIRCYRTEDGRSAIFRLEEHTERLFASAHVAQMEIPYSKEEINDAIVETVRANRLDEAYIRPIAFIGYGNMGLYPGDNPVDVVIAAWKWGAYLGEEGIKNGIRAKVSSFSRHHVNVSMTKAKIVGNYVNSILAKREVVSCGYDEAIMLDPDGFVSEGSGENIFIAKDGVLKTPPLTSILKGITRESVIEIAWDLGIEVVEERFTRDELYMADEAFFTGTAAEITPIREVDDRKIGNGKPGPITELVQKVFFEIIRGKNEQYKHWLKWI